MTEKHLPHSPNQAAEDLSSAKIESNPGLRKGNQPSVTDRDFKGVWIPAELYLSTEIGWSAKIIFLEIDSFTAKDKACFMSNKYLAKFVGISERQVQTHLARLIDLGWVEQSTFDGRNRQLRTLKDFVSATKFSSPQPRSFLHPSHEENFVHNNTINNTITVKDKAKAGSRLFAAFKERFLFYFEKQETGQYYWTAKDSGAISQLMRKITFKCKEKIGAKKESEINQDLLDAACLGAWDIVLEWIPRHGDAFLKNNFTPAIINSKFNEIYLQIKNGNRNHQGPGTHRASSDFGGSF